LIIDSKVSQLQENFPEYSKSQLTEKRQESKLQDKKNSLTKREAEEIKALLKDYAIEFRILKKCTFASESDSRLGESEFLAQKYSNLLSQYPKTTPLMFPQYNPKNPKDFPITFRHTLFSYYRKITQNAGQITVNDSARLGFWAPTGPNAKSKNNLVQKNSKKILFEKVWETRVKADLWEDQNFEAERKKMFMKNEDVKECTFSPVIYDRWPGQFKDLMDTCCPWYERGRVLERNQKKKIESLQNLDSFRGFGRQDSISTLKGFGRQESLILGRGDSFAGKGGQGSVGVLG
jgi:hypothetical protein